MQMQNNLIRPTRSFPIASLIELESALRSSFSVETCYPGQRSEWPHKPAAYGQCAVAALVVQDILGGELICDAPNHHYWNRVEGVDLDFTREQFDESTLIRETAVKPRSEIITGTGAEKAATQERYQVLSEKVKDFLADRLTTK